LLATKYALQREARLLVEYCEAPVLAETKRAFLESINELEEIIVAIDKVLESR
jgi:hypothetical protein